MICRRCLKLFTVKDKVAVQRGGSVHKDKKVCSANLQPHKGKK